MAWIQGQKCEGSCNNMKININASLNMILGNIS